MKLDLYRYNYETDTYIVSQSCYDDVVRFALESDLPLAHIFLGDAEFPRVEIKKGDDLTVKTYDSNGANEFEGHFDNLRCVKEIIEILIKNLKEEL